MAENELKWYDIFVVLFGTVLSIALEITKIVCKRSMDQTGVLCVVLHVGDLVLVLNRSDCLLAKNSIRYTKGIHCSVSLICYSHGNVYCGDVIE